MMIKQFEIWIADLNPQIGTEPGKTRPVLVIQTNLLNKVTHPSTLICPISTNVVKESDILRVHLKKGIANLHDNCDILIDQIRAIDNKRLIKKHPPRKPPMTGTLCKPRQDACPHPNTSESIVHPRIATQLRQSAVVPLSPPVAAVSARG